MAKLNHIGIAIQDLPRMKELFQLLGSDISHSETVPHQGVIAHFVPLQSANSNIEFLEPLQDSSGAVARFLKQKGPGIHHLSFETEKGELDSLCDRLRKNGFRVLYDQSDRGANGMRINFIHPASCGGILIELMEPV